MTKRVYIGLGSNLGERHEYIKKAVEMLGAAQGVRVEKVSSIIETAPLGGIDQPKYLNGVAEIQTDLGATQLHEILRQIENSLGRVRTENKNSPRTIDLDILLFGNEIIETKDLCVPHRSIHFRSFVLKSLCELDRNLVHPVLGRTMDELLSRLNGKDFLPDASRPQLVSIAGVIGAGKTTLARGLADELGAKLLLEAYDTNPFLARVYAGDKKVALDCQLYFLSTRVEQLGGDSLKSGQKAVSDYVFEKEYIYAKRLLDEKQYELYSRIHTMVAARVCEPVVLINLKAPVSECLERIHQRNREYEQRIEKSFLERLASDYEELVRNWDKSPVITVCDEADFRKAEVIKKFAAEVSYYLVNQ